MNKFYKYNVGRNKIVFVKVYGENPDHLPSCLRNSKLICIEQYSLQVTGLISRFKGEISNSILMEREKLEMELRVYKSTEITEDDYNLNLSKLQKLRNVALDVFKELKNYENGEQESQTQL